MKVKKKAQKQITVEDLPGAPELGDDDLDKVSGGIGGGVTLSVKIAPKVGRTWAGGEGGGVGEGGGGLA